MAHKLKPNKTVEITPLFPKHFFIEEYNLGGVLKDIGNTALNSALSPIEMITGKNLFDPDMNTNAGQEIAKAQNFTNKVGSTILPTVANTILPGSGTAINMLQGLTPGSLDQSNNTYKNQESLVGTSSAVMNLAAPFVMANGGSLNMTEYNGPSHENGGIQVGPKAEVEGGEARVGDYIFSDRLKPDGYDSTFAELAKRINKKYSQRQNDAPTERAKAKELEALMTSNEQARMAQEQLDTQMDMEDFEMYGGDIEYKNGGIFIKPSKRGSFTAAAKKRGMGVQEFASRVLSNKDKYSEAMRKKAQFAHNAAGFKHANGGYIYANGGSTTPSTIKYAGIDLPLEDAKKLYDLRNQYNIEHSKYTSQGADLDTKRALAIANSPTYRQIQELSTRYNIPLEVDTSRPSYGQTGDVNKYSALVNPQVILPTTSVAPPVPTQSIPVDPNWQYQAKKFVPKQTEVINPVVVPLPSTGASAQGARFLGTNETYQPNLLNQMANGGDMNKAYWDMIQNANLAANTTNMLNQNTANNNPYLNPPIDFGFGTSEIPALDLDSTIINNLSGVPEPKQYDFFDPNNKFGAKELGLIASSATGAYNMLKGQKPSQTQFERFSPETIDLSMVREQNARNAALSSALSNEQVRNYATTSGQALSNLATQNAAINNSRINADMQSLINEQMANNQIRNQAGMTNTQIANQEIIANEQNKAMADSLIGLGLSDIGQNVQGYMRDKGMQNENTRYNDQLFDLMKTSQYQYIKDPATGEMKLIYLPTFNTGNNG